MLRYPSRSQQDREAGACDKSSTRGGEARLHPVQEAPTLFTGLPPSRHPKAVLLSMVDVLAK